MGAGRDRIDREAVVADLGQQLEGRLTKGDVTGGVERAPAMRTRQAAAGL